LVALMVPGSVRPSIRRFKGLARGLADRPTLRSAKGMTLRLLLLNGSLRGSAGNTATLLQYARASLEAPWQSDTLSLAEYSGSIESLVERLTAADAFLLGTGVYWGSWGSPLQRFLEVMSAYELWLGAFSLLGCLVPPLSTVVVSRVAAAASEADPEANDDVWQADDLRVVVRNLSTASALRCLPWATWPVRKLARLEGPYPSHGVLSAGLAKFT
jgi:hypothetical protein